MAFVPWCDKDVFISYAHDNDHDGWVTRFQKCLAAKLTEYLGAREKPSIWFDDRNLRAGDPVAGEIQCVLEHTAAMVSIISPSYLSSKYCVRDELEHFWRKPESTGRVIVQALKVPLRPGQYVPLSDIKYVEFLERRDNGDIEELDAGDPRFARILNRVAYQLGTHLEELRRKRQSVFIAEPKEGILLDAAQVLRSELQGHGYGIPSDRIADFTADSAIRELIESCNLSIHFFQKTPDPLSKRQFEIALSTSKPMVLVTMTPLDTSSFAGRCDTPVLIATQTNETVALAGDWKHRVVDQVRRHLQPPEPVVETAAARHIYVYCKSKAALGDAADLIDTLRERKMEVLRPNFRITDPAHLQEDHRDKLATSHGVVLAEMDSDAAEEWADLKQRGIPIAEWPASAHPRQGIYQIEESLGGLDRFLEAVTGASREMAP